MNKSILVSVLVSLLQFGQINAAEIGENCTYSPTPTIPPPGSSSSSSTKLNMDVSCNETMRLVCNANNTCECGSGMFWDTSIGFCKSFANKPCKLRPSNSLVPLDCIEHSTCIDPVPETDGMCRCDPKYIASTDGQCRLGHEETGCINHRDCNYYSFLTCSFGTCKCDRNTQTSTTQHWDEADMMCRSLIEGLCSNKTSIENDLERPCVHNAFCDEGKKCKCAADYDSFDGYCFKGFNITCDLEVTKECHPTFQCRPENSSSNETRNACLCDPDKEVHDAVQKKCIVLAGESCASNQNCVEHANCTTDTNLCQCDFGFSKTGSGECKAEKGIVCSVAGDCNSEKYLTCHENKCDCEGGYNYDSHQRVCRGLVGSTCVESPQNQCIERAHCSSQGSEFKCQCDSGTSETPVKTCLGNYNQTCQSSSNPCDDYKYFACVHQKCECRSPAFQVYDERQTKCVARVGERCDLSPIEDKQLGCLTNSTCQGVDDITGICECNDGLVNQGGECVVSAPGGGGSGLQAMSFALLFMISFLKMSFF